MATVCTDVSKVPQSFKTPVIVCNSTARNVIGTVFSDRPHVYMSKSVRLLKITQNDSVT
jgi:hypothetical protein